MDQRLRLVAGLLEDEAMTEVCREFGISRKTGYKILGRYQEHGLEALISGNRDDEVIVEPNQFIADRPRPREHVAFGFGIRCLGNRLANCSYGSCGRRSRRDLEMECPGRRSYASSNFCVQSARYRYVSSRHDAGWFRGLHIRDGGLEYAVSPTSKEGVHRHDATRKQPVADRLASATERKVQDIARRLAGREVKASQHGPPLGA